MKRLLLALAILAAATSSCRGQAPAPPAGDGFARMVDSLAPIVARAAGLEFRQPPRAALRSRDEVRRYLLAKVEHELPPERLEGMSATYRLLGLLPDTLDLRKLLVDLLAEQVVGYYDPDSAMLFGVAGAQPMELQLVVAHELTHALQDQYLPLDSILEMVDESDRQTAAQAVIEGQAMIVSLQAFVPDPAMILAPGFWETARGQVRAMQGGTPIFRNAPLVLRESLLFPYLDGAEFVIWWERSALKDSTPYGRRMPTSTEQVLHPDRYERGDAPLTVRFTGAADVLQEDTMGEMELRILDGHLAGRDQRNESAVPYGWAGDRYRTLRTPFGPALLWYVVWDTPRDRDRWLGAGGAQLAAQNRTGYRHSVEAVEVGGRAATRVIIAPERWAGWSSPPTVRLIR